MPAEVPTLTVVRGDRFVFDLTLWADAGMTQPYDVDTADEVKSELRLTTGAPVIATFQTSLQSANVVRFVLPAEVTGTFSVGGTAMQWDLQITWGTAAPLDVRTVAKGKLQVEGDITESDLLRRTREQSRTSRGVRG